jgi:hypothetical protein
VASEEYVKTELKILGALNYDLGFVPIHQVVHFTCDAINQRFGISLAPEEAIRQAKVAFCTDFFFTENPIIVAVYFVWESAKGNLLWDNFAKALDCPELGTVLEARLREFEAAWTAFVPPTEDQVTTEVKNFVQMNQMLAQLRNTAMRVTPPWG